MRESGLPLCQAPWYGQIWTPIGQSLAHFHFHSLSDLSLFPVPSFSSHTQSSLSVYSHQVFSMDSDDEYEGDDGIITLNLTSLLQGAKEIYDRERPSTRNASIASRDSNRMASQQTVRLVLDHVKAAPTSSTESTEVETSKEDVSRYTACLNTILNSLIAGKKRTDALERDTVPESMLADLTAKYEALKVDQTTLSEAVPLVQAGKGIVEIATQLGMPVGCEFNLICIALDLLTGSVGRRSRV